MNIMTIFKTWNIDNNTINYWQDELPDHDKYTVIIGQANIPEEIVFKEDKRGLSGEQLLCACFEEVLSTYSDNTFMN